MLTNYYTLRALARAWHDDFAGSVLGDAYTQVRGELTLAFGREDGREWMLRASLQAPHVFVYRSEGYNRARRNTVTLFEDALGQDVTAVEIAERDRVLTIRLAGGSALVILPFGPRANVLHADAAGVVIEAFRRDAELEGTQVPAPRPAPLVETAADFAARWKPGKTLAQSVARTLPLFGKTLGAEVAHRSGVSAKPQDCAPEDLAALFAAVESVRADLAAPRPTLYWQRVGKDERALAEVFALFPLRHLAARDDLREERIETLDEAVRTFARRRLGEAHFRSLTDSLAGALEKAATHHRTSAEKMLEELSQPSRADRHERFGHLLMAHAADVAPHADTVTLPDLFADPDEYTGDQPPDVTIPLDARLSAPENAARYYDRARRTREARAVAEERLFGVEAAADEAEALLEGLRGCTTVAEAQRFRKEHADRLARFAGEKGASEDRVPFRRYPLASGYEVWVGRNARQNDDLTFHHARKYDRWLHARGVPGSHAILRVPARNAEPQPAILHAAARIAAYYSKARGSALVPVIVAERKHVRKPRGGAAGAVLVEREQVLLVEPALP